MPELWPFRPLRQLSESLEWFTEVLTSRTGEQRLSLRKAPRQAFNYTHLFDARRYAWAKAFAQRNLHLSVYVPVWSEVQSIGAVGSAATSLLGDFTASDFRVDGKAVVWQDWETYAIVDIDAIADGELTLGAAVGTNFQQALLMPVRESYLVQGMRAERIPTASQISVRFQINDNIDLNDADYFTPPTYPTYLSLEVMTDYPHATASVAEQIIRTSQYVDSGLGQITIEPMFTFEELGQTITFMERVGLEVWTRRCWLHKLRGRHQAFWLPSFNNDLEVSTVTDADPITTLKVLPVSPVTTYYVGRHIMIHMRDGTKYFRAITAAVVNVDPNYHDLTIALLEDAIDPADILFTSFITRQRLNADTITLEHRVSNHVSIVIPVTEVAA